MKKIYIIYNYWELFLSLILIHSCNKNYNNILFINIEKFDKVIIEKIEKKYQVKKFDFLSNKIIKFFSYYFKLIVYLPLKIKQYINEELEIIAFSDQEIIARYFIKNKKNIILYEHGIVNYQDEFKDLTQKIKQKIFQMEKPYGRNKYIKNIFLKFPEKAPEDIRKKVKKLNAEKLIENLSMTSKKEILDIFSLNLEMNEENIALLLTQPLEIKTCSEKEKKRIYEKIYEKYSKDYTVYIKPHPLEKTDYTYLTDKVLGRKFPIELFLINNVNLKKVITLFSSGCFDFINKCDVDFLGTTEFKEIYQKRKINSNFYKKGEKC